MKDPFNGKRGRQKGQTKDIVTIKDPLFAPYEIQEDKNCYTLLEPGNNAGEWKYHFPDELNVGIHTLTIVSIDAAGNSNQFDLQLEKP
jgi:hypothetical protein